MKTYRQKILTYITLTAAGIINAFGITFFLYPVHLYDSGISGLSILLAPITPDFSKVRDIVREYDKAAYVTIVDVADVL